MADDHAACPLTGSHAPRTSLLLTVTLGRGGAKSALPWAACPTTSSNTLLAVVIVPSAVVARRREGCLPQVTEQVPTAVPAPLLMRERRAPTSDLLFANSRPPHPLRVREREPSRRSITCSQRTTSRSPARLRADARFRCKRHPRRWSPSDHHGPSPPVTGTAPLPRTPSAESSRRGSNGSPGSLCGPGSASRYPD
jgi:hypothetical protein